MEHCQHVTPYISEFWIDKIINFVLLPFDVVDIVRSSCGNEREKFVKERRRCGEQSSLKQIIWTLDNIDWVGTLAIIWLERMSITWITYLIMIIMGS